MGTTELDEGRIVDAGNFVILLFVIVCGGGGCVIEVYILYVGGGG